MRFSALSIIFLLSGCAGDYGYPPDDLARGGFDGGAASDLGFIPSDAAMLNDANLTSPLAWTSLVPLDSTFQFDVNLPKAPSELEGFFSIMQRPGGAPLAGAFSWKGSAGVYKLTFIPSAKLADSVDYEVHIALPFKPKVGISTGSHPRVRGLKLEPSGASDLTLTISFSEPMKEVSLFGKVVLTAGSPPVTISNSSFSKTDPSTFRVVIPGGQTLPSPIMLRLEAGIQALTGTVLDPKSWDSTTDVMGDFEFVFPGPSSEFVPELW